MNGEYTGIVEHVGAETATVRLEMGEDGADTDTEIDDTIDVDLELLPAGALEERSVLAITLSNGEFVDAELRPGDDASNRGILVRLGSALSRLVP